ncbi:type II secretion system protein N [Frateuria defendens]|uniref:type II secretion system protein N n=1 Tax=Frateuria defendens TaxID=2219559 RepID=UPI00066FFC05|nr:type II secretion system protein N [Frateuria defendens]
MRPGRRVLITAGVLLLAAAALLCCLPARWAMPWIAPRLHGLALGEVHGSLWDGQADEVRSADGRVLGALHWQLSRQALLGRLALALQLEGPQLDFRGRLQRDAPTQFTWEDVHLRVDLAAFAPSLPALGGAPRGALQLSFDRLQLQGVWPLQGQGEVQWRDAELLTARGQVPLGQLAARLSAEQGVLQGAFGDDGHGPLAARGRWRASPLGWRLEAQLAPRGEAPALRRWLATLGTPDAQGRVNLTRHGGLMGGQALPQAP